MGKFIDLKGQKFGRLTVVERCGNDKDHNVLWRCVCECGNEKVVNSRMLRRGLVKGCGCLQAETQFKEKHGLSRTQVYKIWQYRKRSCFDPNNEHYPDYGGRGITMCDLWKDNPEAFCDYVSKLPHFGEKGYTLNRINNDGNYEPDNVEWATATEQNNNKRSNRYITYNGKTQTLKQWSDELGINYKKLCARINDHGWSIEKAFNTP